MPDPHDNKPKLVHEQVLALLQGSARQAMDLFREPEAVVVTVLWDARLGDLPGAVVVTRPGEPLGPHVGSRVAAQLAKAGANLLGQVYQQLQHQEAVIAALRDELERLRRETEAHRGGAEGGGAGGPTGPGGPEGGSR